VNPPQPPLKGGSLYDLLEQHGREYQAKMMHEVPRAEVVEREVYILQRAKGKRVLDIGATGPMHEAIKELAEVCYGVDIVEKEEENYFRVDLDRVDHLPRLENIDMIIAGEVIEHLSNAGHFLDLLAEYDCPIILTTPNAFSSAGMYQMRRGVENVNKEHTAYYSWKTLSTLLERHGFQMDDFRWYNGQPYTAEGLICLISKRTR